MPKAGASGAGIRGSGSGPFPMKVAYFIKPLILHKRQKSDRRSKSRNDGIRPDFMKRLKDKAPLMHSRVRHHEFRRLINRAVTEKLDIEIDRPGGVMNARGADASEIKLNFLHRVKQVLRRNRHREHRRGIRVVRTRRVDRSRTVETAYPLDTNPRHLVEPPQRLSERLFGVPEIRPQADHGLRFVRQDQPS